jgi:hypothetical protein
MLEFGPLAFASPWILTALALLPVLWWLLRVTPPAPLVRAFPPLRLLLALTPQEETPAHTPLWLILLRMLIAALVILALAHPLFNPGARLAGSGPLILVIDDGWAAGARWTDRRKTMFALIDRAEREDRAVVVLAAAKVRPGEPPRASGLLRPAEARRLVRALKPKPWTIDRKAVLEAVSRMEITGSAHVAWLADGLADGHTERLAEQLQAFGSLTVHTDDPEVLAPLVRAPVSDGDGLSVPVFRPDARGRVEMWLRASTEDGRMLARREVIFADGEHEARAGFTLPGELRNKVARFEIEGRHSAGAVFLMDERWRRRPVGIASGEASEAAQPLLSDVYYLTRALEPFSEVRKGVVSKLLKRNLAVLVLADIGRLTESESRQVRDWMERGGVVVRFAGPKLAANVDALIPVRVRRGGRELGGIMSWSRPAKLLPFGDSSPFAGLRIPPDVRVQRQVLAEPTIDLNDKTWARLSDGTPLVTAAKQGQGWLILVHTTANTEWSNLPISGLFIGMLQRIVGLSQGIVGDDAGAVLPPIETLDGFGAMGAPPSTAIAIPGRKFAATVAAPATPPGYYGRGSARRALNLANGIETLTALDALPDGVEWTSYRRNTGTDLKPWLLLAALVLLLADLAISFVMRGLVSLPGGRKTARAAQAALIIFSAATVALAPGPVRAQANAGDSAEIFALKAVQETRLAYVRTGDRSLDSVSRAGMAGLSEMLRQRTAVEPGEPMEVNIEQDELAFFPLLYWAVSPAGRPLSEQAVEKLNAYLRNGGTILFDTREQGSFAYDLFGGGGPAATRLRRILGVLDIPSLIPVPKDHVLTKSFYLLREFPGRWTGGTVWVEQRGGRHNDGVSTVIIGANDWAGAWAADFAGSPLLPVVPGGGRQREMAYRFGINWVMYALTGNYKTDQVHMPAIIERLGQ